MRSGDSNFLRNIRGYLLESSLSLLTFVWCLCLNVLENLWTEVKWCDMFCWVLLSHLLCAIWTPPARSGRFHYNLGNIFVELMAVFLLYLSLKLFICDFFLQLYHFFNAFVGRRIHIETKIKSWLCAHFVACRAREWKILSQ